MSSGPWVVPLSVSGPGVPVMFAAIATVAASSRTTAVMDPSSAFFRSNAVSPEQSVYAAFWPRRRTVLTNTVVG